MSEVTAQFDVNGFAIMRDVVAPSICDSVVAELELADSSRVGARTLLSQSWCSSLVQRLRENPLVNAFLPPRAAAIQCTLFDKSATNNWLVSIHQDLSIPVKERVDSGGCSGWSHKDDVLFVQPPISVLESLLAIRLHLDDSTENNGPLRVVPGSHRNGRLASEQAVERRALSGVVDCPVPKGGILLLRPLLLHASSKAKETAPRRVLHFVFGPPKLPHGLSWHSAI